MSGKEISQMTELVNAAFDVSGSVPLLPPLALARASLDTNNQKAARKGANYGIAAILGVSATIAIIIAIALLATAKSPRLQDGRWYGGWSVLLLAALPLFAMTTFVLWRNQECQGDVVALAANFGPGKIGKAAQFIQQQQQ